MSRARGGEPTYDWLMVSGARGKPEGAKVLQELRVPREAVELERRRVCEFLDMEPHGEHACEL